MCSKHYAIEQNNVAWLNQEKFTDKIGFSGIFITEAEGQQGTHLNSRRLSFFTGLP